MPRRGRFGILLRRLLQLQALYVLMALTYLGISDWYLQTRGAGLSTAPPVPAIIIFLLYGTSLLLGVFRWIGPYRCASALAIPIFAAGGVFGNIGNYLSTGIEGYHSLTALALGTAMNIYGLIWNVVAALGLFRK